MTDRAWLGVADSRLSLLRPPQETQDTRDKPQETQDPRDTRYKGHMTQETQEQLLVNPNS